MNMGAKSALCKCKMEIFNKRRGHQVRPLYEFAFCTLSIRTSQCFQDNFRCTYSLRMCACVYFAVKFRSAYSQESDVLGGAKPLRHDRSGSDISTGAVCN